MDTLHSICIALLVFAEVVSSLNDILFFVQANTTYFLKNPESQIVSRNSSVTFNCTANVQPTNFSPHPQLDIIWRKNGIMIQSNDRINIINNKGYSQLNILNVQLNDTGRYQCVVNDGPSYENNDNNLCNNASSFYRDRAWRFITLSLPAYLNVTGELQDAKVHNQLSITAVFNQPLVLHCNISNVTSGPDYIEWIFNETPLFKNQKNTSKEWTNLGQKLLIHNMTDSTLGNYSCTATRFTPFEVVHVIFNITLEENEYNGAPLLVISHQNIAVNGSKYELNCITAPNKDMAIMWKKDGETIGLNHSLVFEVISVQDNGLYCCILKQDNSVNATIDVKVYVSPIFSSEMVSTIFLNKGASMPVKHHIRCNATGTPSPIVTLYMNGEPLSYNPIDVQVQGIGIYQCFATNCAGAAYFTTRVLYQETISAPSNMNCSTTIVPGAVFNVSITWMMSNSFLTKNLPARYFIYACAGQNTTGIDIKTSDTYQHLQMNATSNTTISVYVFSEYSLSTGDFRSAPSFCNITRFTQKTIPSWNVDCKAGVANLISNDHPLQQYSLNSLWMICLNENLSLTDKLWSSSTDLVILNTTHLLQKNFQHELCLFGGTFTTSKQIHQIPVNVCSPVGIKKVPLMIKMHMYLSCSTMFAVLIWNTSCLNVSEVYIYGTCRNLTHNITKYATASTYGEINIEIPLGDYVCAFHAAYTDGKQASNLLYCYNEKKSDTEITADLECSPGMNDIVSLAISTIPPAVILLVVAGLLVVVTIIVVIQQRTSRAQRKLNQILSLVSQNSLNLNVFSEKSVPIDCHSVVTEVDNLFFTEKSSWNLNNSDVMVYPIETYYSSSDYSSDPYQMPSCDTSHCNT